MVKWQVVVDAKVLLVDDDPGFLESLDDILQLHGVATARASSGREAIKMSGEDTFDLVLMDVDMPGVDGIDAFAALKLGGQAGKVFFVTAREGDPRVARAIRDGAIGVMYKPLDVHKLLDLVRGACENNNPQDPTIYKYQDAWQE